MQPFRHILFAADFSENSQEAFRVACSLCGETKTRMSVIHVVEPHWVAEEPVYFGQPAVQYFDSGPEPTGLEALHRKLVDQYTPNHAIDITYFVKEGEISSEILDLAEQTASDLIVMGTHGRTGLRWLLAGSVAISVLRRRPARCLPCTPPRFPVAPRISRSSSIPPTSPRVPRPHSRSLVHSRGVWDRGSFSCMSLRWRFT